MTRVFETYDDLWILANNFSTYLETPMYKHAETWDRQGTKEQINRTVAKSSWSVKQNYKERIF